MIVLVGMLIGLCIAGWVLVGRVERLADRVRGCEHDMRLHQEGHLPPEEGKVEVTYAGAHEGGKPLRAMTVAEHIKALETKCWEGEEILSITVAGKPAPDPACRERITITIDMAEEGA